MKIKIKICLTFSYFLVQKFPFFMIHSVIRRKEYFEITFNIRSQKELILKLNFQHFYYKKDVQTSIKMLTYVYV